MTDGWRKLPWAGGRVVDVWKDSNDSGWSAASVSGCAQNSGDPGSILLSISGPHLAALTGRGPFCPPHRGQLPFNVVVASPVGGAK